MMRGFVDHFIQKYLTAGKEEQETNDPNLVWERIQHDQAFLPVPTTKATDNISYQNQQHSKNASQEEVIGNEGETKATGKIRIACMSDTHGNHRKIFVPKCDILVHAGDLTLYGEMHVLQDLADYFLELVQEKRVGKVICIAGNHDLVFQPEIYNERLNRLLNRTSLPTSDGSNDDSTGTSEIENKDEDILNSDGMRYFKKSCTYLQDESYIHNNGIEFYGSPWSPIHGRFWAFMKERDMIHEQWDLIPESVDVLITHGPPLGRGDRVLWKRRNRAGCANLLHQIQTRIQPRLCVFGHIHEDAGTTFDGKTLYVNAANVSIRYTPQRPCTVIDLPLDRNEIARVVLPKCSWTGEEVLKWLKSQGYLEILPYFERCTPLLDGHDLVVGLELNLEEVAQRLNVNHSTMQDVLMPFGTSKKCRDQLVTAMLHLQSLCYE